MRTIIWFIYFWLYLIVLLPRMYRVKKMFAQGQTRQADELTSKTVVCWANRLLGLAGVKITVSGQEYLPKTPCVFVCNHQGYFDIPIVLTQLGKPHSILAKEETAKIPMIRTWMEYLHCVFIDRHDVRQSAAALNKAIENIKKGYSVVIFPEGTRSRGDRVGEFKPGGFRAAQKTGVPIVPVCIDGSYKVMEMNHMMIKPAQIKVTILPMISTEEFSKEDFKLVGEQVREMIIECKENKVML